MALVSTDPKIVIKPFFKAKMRSAPELSGTSDVIRSVHRDYV